MKGANQNSPTRRKNCLLTTHLTWLARIVFSVIVDYDTSTL